MKKEFKCCICGAVFTGWGNDPWPVNTEDNAECCDRCNALEVVPARVRQMQERRNNG